MSEPRYQPGERVQIPINRLDANFDRACDSAYHLALMMFGADEDGHLTNVKDSERSCDTIVVEFIGYRHSGSMAGQSHDYEFVAWVDRYEEEDDE
jgi:hypothetical protein